MNFVIMIIRSKSPDIIVQCILYKIYIQVITQHFGIQILYYYFIELRDNYHYQNNFAVHYQDIGFSIIAQP